MIDINKRLVVFSELDDANNAQSWYHYIWDHTVETHYSVNNINDFDCNYNRGDSVNDLFILFLFSGGFEEYFLFDFHFVFSNVSCIHYLVSIFFIL